MNLKKITSLSMLLSMIIMTYTGIILFITPPGRIAHWAEWTMLGLTKEEYSALHSTFMVLFIVATILHIYYNFKPMISYMRNSAKALVVFTKEMIVATLLCVVFFVGTLYEVVPFSKFLQMGETIKDSWEKTYGAPPYAHAELSSLSAFIKKLGFDKDKTEQTLKANNIKYDMKQSLGDIAKENNTSPKAIYDMIQKSVTQKMVIKEFSGLGQKMIKDVATTLGVPTQKLIDELKSLGIEAKESDKFKTKIEEYNLSPLDVLQKLGYSH